MTYVQFKGRGAEPFSEETVRVFDWMTMKVRRFYSQEERIVYSIRPWDNFFWSVELFDFPEKSMIDPLFANLQGHGYRPAKTEFFRIVDNSLRIRSTADRGVVFLSPEQLDFNRKMEVVFNGKIDAAKRNRPRKRKSDARRRKNASRPATSFLAPSIRACPGSSTNGITMNKFFINDEHSASNRA